MKTRRFAKSRKLKRRSSKKRGGMFRGTTRITGDAAKKAAKEALKKIFFGEDPVDAADKAKQTADKIKEAMKEVMKSRQGQQLKQSPYVPADTFSSPVSFGSPFVSIRGDEHHDPNAFFKTPSKKPDQNEPILEKTTRHKSVVARTPQSYAPRLGDETPVNKILFE